MTTSLLTDQYELTMVQAAMHSGRANRRTVFEVFTRRLPEGRRYGVLAGTGRVLEALRDFRFSEADLRFIQDHNLVDSRTLKWLETFRFSGSIRGYSEGDVYFGGSPVLTVEGSFAECVVLETLILSILNYDSAIAGAATRMRSAAGSRRLIEMGARRGHERAAVSAARAAYICGFDATSNLEAGRSYGVPTAGTAAHAFTLLHEDESEAFRAQIATLGVGTTLLVDTYDVAAAIRLGVSLTNGKLGAVRLDSGDLVTQAAEARTLLDALGAHQTKVVVTSDLDEFAIAGLAASPVDTYGVGTSLVTGSGYPTAGFVYKLVAFEEGGSWVPVAKRSTAKLNQGGKKFVYRKVSGGAITEIATLRPDSSLGQPLQQDLVIEGASLLSDQPASVTEMAREQHATAMKSLPGDAFRLSRGEPVAVLQFSDSDATR